MPIPFTWLRSAPTPARRALLAASLGWMLDSFDVLLYALLLPSIIAALHLTKSAAGLLGSLTLVAGAAGGVLFGLAADRWGRTRALRVSVLLYAVFTACCGLAWSFASLALFRIFLGFGMGGEWATGAALVSETWPRATREKALALLQSSFAVGYGLAAVVVFLLLPLVGWRGVFFVGLAPALLTLWMRRHVHEPPSWQQARLPTNAPVRPPAGLSVLFHKPLLRSTLSLTLMNACCLFAWWGFNLWVPSYLSLPIRAGGIGLAPRTLTLILVVMQTGMWCGYISFGYLASAFGLRRMYVTFLVAAAGMLALFPTLHSPVLLITLCPCLAFAATGYYSGFAAVTADTYPAPIRATAQGFTYNLGRLASAAAPYVAGTLAQHHGFSPAFRLDAAVFLLAAALWFFIPQTTQVPSLAALPSQPAAI